MKDKEGNGKSESGDPIYRYGERAKPFELSLGNEETISAIGEHIEKLLGKVEMVFHELISEHGKGTWQGTVSSRGKKLQLKGDTPKRLRIRK